MKRLFLLAALVFTSVLLIAWTMLAAQIAEGPKFEVASIKHIGPTLRNVTPTGLVSPTRFSATANEPAFVVRAFDVHPSLIANLDQVPDEFYTITAILPNGATKNDVPAMVRNLLIERFHLQYHRETREVKQFELRVAETGLKMKDVSNERSPEPSSGSYTNTAGLDGYVKFLPGRNIGPVGFAGRWGMQRIGISMREFARELSGHLLDSVVTDGTGLTGKYSFTLKWSERADAISSASADPPEFTDPPLRSALRQQLGLVAHETMGPAEVIVIDNMDREPSAN